MDHYKFKNKKLLLLIAIGLTVVLIIISARLMAGEIIIDFPSSNYVTENDVRDHTVYIGLYNANAAVIFDLPFDSDSLYNVELFIIARQDSMPPISAELAIVFDNQTSICQINSETFNTFYIAINNISSDQVKFRFNNAAYVNPGGLYNDRNLYLDKITINYTPVYTELPDSLRQITLSWDANTEPDLAGYKLYYGWSPREYQYQLVTISNNLSLSTDKYKTYYFAVTAYDFSGNESGYSNEVMLAAVVDPIPLEYYEGDVNENLIVDHEDFFIILAHYWQVGTAYDMNGDNVINEYEFFRVLADWWKTGYKEQIQ